jgi:hypothetical protein
MLHYWTFNQAVQKKSAFGLKGLRKTKLVGGKKYIQALSLCAFSLKKKEEGLFSTKFYTNIDEGILSMVLDSKYTICAHSP